MESSKLAAERIRQDVLRTLEAADDIGGPDVAEYVELMETLAKHCQRLADMATCYMPQRKN